MLRQNPRMREDTRNELDPETIALSPEARAVLVSFADVVEAELMEGRELATVRPFAAKAAEHACRIAGVMSAFDGRHSVDVSCMADATALERFYLNEAVRLADVSQISAEAAQLERMRRWLIESWPEQFISATDAAQRGPFKETAKSRKTLQEIAKLDWLIPVEGGEIVKGKRRREAFKVVRAESRARSILTRTR